MDAHLWAQVKETGAREMAVAARESSRRLQVSWLVTVDLISCQYGFMLMLISYEFFKKTQQALSSQERKQILLDIADALEANKETIKTENDADIAAAQLAGYDKSLVARLALKPGKARP